MTTTHSAEACHDTQCPLSNCVNWKMRNVLGKGNHVTNKRKSRRTTVGEGGSRQEAGHGASEDKTIKRRALPKANRKKARESPSPHDGNSTLLQVIGQAQSTCVAIDVAPAPVGDNPITWSSINTTTATQLSYPVPKADSGWITLDSSPCTFGTPLSLTTSFDERDFEQLLQCSAIPGVPNATNGSVANYGSHLGPGAYPAAGQNADKKPASLAPFRQDNIAIRPVGKATALLPTSANLTLASPNASEAFTSMPASIEGGASDPLMAHIFAYLASQDGHQTASDPASTTTALSTLPNIPTSTAQTDTPRMTPRETSVSPLWPQCGATSKNSGQEPNTEFIRTVLNYFSRIITILGQPRSNHLEERFISILEEAVCKLESSTAWS